MRRIGLRSRFFTRAVDLVFLSELETDLTCSTDTHLEVLLFGHFFQVKMA